MSSIGFSSRTIGAHADHNTTHFFFQRAQSLETRDMPWEKRIRPLTPWHQYAMYAAAFMLVSSVVAFVAI